VNNTSNSPDTQPYRSIQAKLWQVVGLVLIGGGLLVMGWAGWTYYQQQAELINPPAPIIDSAAMETLETPTIPPEPTEPLAIAQSNANDAQPVKITPSPTPPPEPAGNSPALAEDNTTLPTPTTDPPAAEIAPTDVIQASTSSEEALVPLDVSTEDIPSLADNPLPVVVEDVEQSEIADPPPRNAASAPPTRIVAESINLDTSVIETGWEQVDTDGVTTNVWIVADYAAGWHNNSSLPGEGGNIVLSGHHNIKGEVFRYIVELEVGDIVSLFVDDQQYNYAITDKFIVKDKGEPDSVRRANAKWIGPFNEERLTLVTCWPYNNNTHRVIVIAKPL